MAASAGRWMSAVLESVSSLALPPPPAVLHASVMLVQVVTLNVAINSHSKALLTIMVSNNFVEIKSSVFKKFEQKNLFQISCSGEYVTAGVYMFVFCGLLTASPILPHPL